MREILAYVAFAFVPTTATLAALWLSARARAAKAESLSRALLMMQPTSHAETEGRFAALGREIESVAEQVERLAESQHFLTQLLAERNGAGVSSILPGSPGETPTVG